MFRSIIAPSQLDAMVTLAKKVPRGDFAEVGVFRGGSAIKLYEVCVQQGRWLHLFDTFKGTPNCTPEVDRHKIDNEFAAPEMVEYIRKHMPLAQLHIGEYPQTHPQDMPALAFIHCDCDQYLSYRAVIDNLWPLVVSGGIMLFDDYPYLAGAKLAVEESFKSADLLKCGQRFYVIKP